MQRLLAFVLCVAVGCHPPLALSQTAAENKTPLAAEQFIGAWHLISIETIRPNGEVIYPFYGRHPEGLLTYDRSGWMSVQIVSDPKPSVPTVSSRQEFLAAAPNEKLSAVDGYYAYFGTWTVDSTAQTVTHHIVQSLYPGERGEEGTRHAELSGDRLVLTAKTHEMGEDHERRLVWERIKSIR